jgi:SH3 domain-containing protein
VFCPPYTSDVVGEDWVDDEDGVNLARNARVRARPDPAAPVVGVLSYDVVKMNYERSVPPDSDYPAWVRITTPGGKGGYVAGRYIRSVIDYSACFEKRRGRWWMTEFIAGD